MRAAFCCDSFLEYPIPIPPDIPPSRACDESGLEIEFFFRDFFEIDIWVDDTGLDEFLAVSVSFIQINGSDEGFEGIAEHVVVVRTGAHGIGDEIIET